MQRKRSLRDTLPRMQFSCLDGENDQIPNHMLDRTYEVFKHVLRERGEDEAFRAVAYVKQGVVVGLDSSLAIQAARISHERTIPMADSMILATARACDAELWTQDSVFEGIDGVRYISKSENGS